MNATLPASTPNTNTGISPLAQSTTTAATFLSTPLTLLNAQIEQSQSQSQSLRSLYGTKEDNDDDDDFYVSVAPTQSDEEDEKGKAGIPSSYQPSPHSRVNRYHDRKGKSKYQPELYQSQPMYEDSSEESSTEDSSEESSAEGSCDESEEHETRRGQGQWLF
jgi:hypothetical protein